MSARHRDNGRKKVHSDEKERGCAGVVGCEQHYHLWLIERAVRIGEEGASSGDVGSVKSGMPMTESAGLHFVKDVEFVLCRAEFGVRL